MKGNRKKIVIGVVAFLFIAIISQAVESRLDKEAIKSYVSNHLVEEDFEGEHEKMEFEREEQQASNIFEWIGF